MVVLMLRRRVMRLAAITGRPVAPVLALVVQIQVAALALVAQELGPVRVIVQVLVLGPGVVERVLEPALAERGRGRAPELVQVLALALISVPCILS